MHLVLSPTDSPSQTQTPNKNKNQARTTTTGTLYLGSLAAACESSLLREHGITHLVQVLDGPWLPSEEAVYDTSLPPFAYFRIDLEDAADAAPRLRKKLVPACDYIRDALAGGRNVLVHCHQVCPVSSLIFPMRRCGDVHALRRRRALSCFRGVVVIAFLIRDRAMPYAAARAFVRARRRCVRPNAGFEEMLREWEGSEGAHTKTERGKEGPVV
ncbi:hypothetical protein DFH09DRAFT_1406543 [Mycena vulgaris]|nr:hypothetical protein DFH09DRAFT_1406543 [Mycena vulgaris]